MPAAEVLMVQRQYSITRNLDLILCNAVML